MSRNYFNMFLGSIPIVLHCCQFYVICDDRMLALKPNLSSLMFLISATLLVVRKLELPQTPFCWPNTFVSFYKIVAMILLPSLALGYLWLPMVYVVAAFNKNMTLLLQTKALNANVAKFFVSFLKCPLFLATQQLALSFYILYSVATALGLKEWLKSCQQLTQCVVNDEECDDNGFESE